MRDFLSVKPGGMCSGHWILLTEYLHVTYGYSILAVTHMCSYIFKILVSLKSVVT